MEPIQSYEEGPFSGSKCPFVLNKTFLVPTINTTLVCILALFIMQNLKKILTVDPELWGCAIFRSKIAQLAKWEFFSENPLIDFVPFIHAYLHAKNQSQLLIY